MNAFVAAGYEGQGKQQKNDPHETSVYCREPVQDAGSAGSTQMNARRASIRFARASMIGKPSGREGKDEMGLGTGRIFRTHKALSTPLSRVRRVAVEALEARHHAQSEPRVKH